PSVQTLNLAAYGESDTGLWLRAADADTLPENLVYVLTALPDGGFLHFDALAEDSEIVVLEVGDSFTQSEMNDGLLAYRHTDPAVNATSFSVTIGDGDHAPVEAEIAVAVFPPDSSTVSENDHAGIPVWWRDENVVFEAYWNLRQN